MSNGSASLALAAPAPAAPKQAAAARTRLLLEGPVVSTLLRLASANVVVNVVLIAVTATVDAYFVAQLGASALAGISLVFPLVMLMQQVANSSMGAPSPRQWRGPSVPDATPTPLPWSCTPRSSRPPWPRCSARSCCSVPRPSMG